MPQSGVNMNVPELTASLWSLLRINRNENSGGCLVTSNESEAERVYQILKSLSFPFQDAVSIFFLPSWRHHPSHLTSTSATYRRERISTLISCVHGHKKPAWIVASADAIFQKCPAFNRLSRHSFKLSEKSDCSALGHNPGRALLRLGYTKVDLVTDCGTYAHRGEVLDIFPPTTKLPVRAEFFGDHCERLRYFEPTSQLASEPNLGSLIIPPAREFFILEEERAELRLRLKQLADDAGVSRAIRDPLLAKVESGQYPSAAEFWGGLLPEHSSFYKEFGQHGGAFYELSPGSSLCAWFNSRVSDRARWDNKNEIPIPDENLYDLPSGSRQFHLQRVPQIPFRSLAGQMSLTNPEWKQDSKIFLFSKNGVEQSRFLSRHPEWAARVSLCIGPISGSYLFEETSEVLLRASDLFESHDLPLRTRAPKKEATPVFSGLQSLFEIQPGDLIVHRVHGLGKYLGLVQFGETGMKQDFVSVEYAGNDKLFVPVVRLNDIQRYFGDAASQSLDKLGGERFTKAKARAARSIRKLALDLLKIQAKREAAKAVAVRVDESEVARFENEFPYMETEGQASAIDDVTLDIASGRLMDRLICGDVGFGKTEVAMRAAIRVVLAGGKVLVIAPTTLLVQQHQLNFKKRFSSFPVNVDSLSRIKSPKNQKLTLENYKQGKVDILISTHRVFSEKHLDPKPALVVIDEEHRFGVEHKERLKLLADGAHMLSLSATPIPRTLSLALLGVKKLSLIHSPPKDRQPIQTHIIKKDRTVIREAIIREIERGGQVYYVHNRVEDIHKEAAFIQETVPEAVLGVIHGKMPASVSEKILLEYLRGHIQVLLCTTIVESGLDVPNANTLIINNAQNLGIAQLYQLRGRIGRSDRAAFSYFIVPDIQALSADATLRLDSLRDFFELGSGYNLAVRDMEIRGTGTLLGPEQSGHIDSIGFDLYREMLEAAVRGTEHAEEAPLEAENFSPEVQVEFPAFLPKGYISSEELRLGIYKKISGCLDGTALNRMRDELLNRFGRLPQETENLLTVIKLRNSLKSLGAESLHIKKDSMVIGLPKGSKINSVNLLSLLASKPDTYSIRDGSKLYVRNHSASFADATNFFDGLIRKIS